MVPAPKEIPFEEQINWGYMTQELFFRYGALFLFGFSLFLKPLRSSNLNNFGIFFLLAFVNVLFRDFDVQARRSLLNLGVAVVFLKTIADYMDSNDLKAVGYWFLGIILLNLFLSAQQYFKADPIFITNPGLGPKDSMVGFMRMKVHLGALVSILSPFLFLVSPALLIVAVPLLCVANSSAAIACFVLGTGVLLFLKMKRSHFLALAVCLLALGGFYIYKFDMPGGDFTERFKIWNFVYGYAFKTSPFIGNGVGSYLKLGVSSTQENGHPQIWTWAHNEYIQAFYEFGFAGVFLIVGYLLKCLYKFREFFKDRNLQVLFASMLSIAGISFLHFPFHLGRLSIPCLFVMGLFQARIKDLENEN